VAYLVNISPENYNLSLSVKESESRLFGKDRDKSRIALFRVLRKKRRRAFNIATYSLTLTIVIVFLIWRYVNTCKYTICINSDKQRLP